MGETAMKNVETIMRMENEIVKMQKKCRHFERQNQLLIEHIKRSDNMIQDQELRLWKLEKRFPEDDHK